MHHSLTDIIIHLQVCIVVQRCANLPSYRITQAIASYSSEKGPSGYLSFLYPSMYTHVLVPRTQVPFFPVSSAKKAIKPWETRVVRADLRRLVFTCMRKEKEMVGTTRKLMLSPFRAHTHYFRNLVTKKGSAPLEIPMERRTLCCDI